MQIRIEETAWAALTAHILERVDVETAAVLLAEPFKSGADTVLAVRSWAPVPEDGYLIRHVDQIRIDPVAINRLVRPARERGLTVLTVHSHPMALDAWFSHADDLGDGRLLPSFARLVPGVPHGSLVVARSGAVVARGAGRRRAGRCRSAHRRAHDHNENRDARRGARRRPLRPTGPRARC